MPGGNAVPHGSSPEFHAAPQPLEPCAAAPSRAQAATLEQALLQAGGNKAKAARLLGISRRTLYRRLELQEPGEL